MEIANKEMYCNMIYTAIVVNNDITMDPLDRKRIQIYIPQTQYIYSSIYENYMKDTNKMESSHKNKFPWAVTLESDLKIGDIVYGGYINNEVNNYIILGKDTGLSSTTSSNNSSNGTLNGANIIELAMPIILQNEVGVPTSDYPDNIPSNKFTMINPYDNGGWSIGLLQWHHTRAFDCCYYIAKNDSNWETRFTDRDMDLFRDLQASVNVSSSNGYRNKYQSTFHPTVGTPLYTSIQNLLGSETGKSCQLKYSKEDTSSALALLQTDYNIQNPALLIYLLDIMNQYGNGISSKTKASEICKDTTKTMMQQLEEFRSYWRIASGMKYTTRRDRTYSYIVELEKQGKLNTLDLTSLEGANEGGKLLWPAPNCKIITSKYGMRGAISGTTHTSANFHSGIDLSKSGGSGGEKIIAVANGIVTTASLGYNGGYGNYTVIDHGEGLTTRYAHQESICVQTGQTVKAGQVIGYIDSTGNSSGPHLHFEVRLNGQHTDPLPYIKV